MLIAVKPGIVLASLNSSRPLRRSRNRSMRAMPLEQGERLARDALGLRDLTLAELRRDVQLGALGIEVLALVIVEGSARHDLTRHADLGRCGRVERSTRGDRRGGDGALERDGVALDRFSPAVREWFTTSFPEPTPAQAQGWPAIAGGDHTLILAPTGSGKTLAAFLWGLDRCSAEPPPEDRTRRTRVLYVSPLRALAVDVERNLRAPLQGIALAAERLGESVHLPTVGMRTGDTPADERRTLVRHPPDVLITTPESLFLMLTSQAREALAGVRWVIIDEIHAMAATKRGAHLSLSLERLDELVRAGGGASPQRIGLSATVGNPERVLDSVVAGEPGAVLAGLVRSLDLGPVVVAGGSGGSRVSMLAACTVSSIAAPSKPQTSERESLRTGTISSHRALSAAGRS